jgi:hypothetical protein
MASDLSDGRIELGGGLILDAALTEATLLHVTAGEAKPLVHNGVHRSYLLPKMTLNGRVFRPSVFFTDGKITLVQLTWADPEIQGGSPWENFSWERERSIEKADALWLADTLGGDAARTPTHTFDWGSIWSGLDEREGFSSIVLRYEHR